MRCHTLVVLFTHFLETWILITWVEYQNHEDQKNQMDFEIFGSKKKTHNKFGTLFNADKFRIRCMSHFYDWEKQREENWTHKFLNCTKSIAFRLHSGFLLLSNDSMGFDATNVRLTEQNSEDTWNCWIHISSPHFFFFLKYHAMKYYTLQLSTAAAAMFCFINQNNNGKINT